MDESAGADEEQGMSEPMFPLGSVLFPSMPLPLRVFEPRYLAMLSDILPNEPSEFGVVLIERGQEVGGGERRFAVGTLAQISELDTSEDFVVLVAQGTHRFEVVTWLDDNPYPKAEIRMLPDLEWHDYLRPLRAKAEESVRRILRLATDLAGEGWPADVQLSDDPVDSCWQLAAIAPLGPLDQVVLLASANLRVLLTSLIEFVEGAEESFRALYPEDE
jgi:Lon protease-like protein